MLSQFHSPVIHLPIGYPPGSRWLTAYLGSSHLLLHSSSSLFSFIPSCLNTLVSSAHGAHCSSACVDVDDGIRPMLTEWKRPISSVGGSILNLDRALSERRPGPPTPRWPYISSGIPKTASLRGLGFRGRRWNTGRTGAASGYATANPSLLSLLGRLPCWLMIYFPTTVSHPAFIWPPACLRHHPPRVVNSRAAWSNAASQFSG